MLRLLSLVMLVVVIAGCSTGEIVTDVPFSTATPRPIESIEAPGSLGDVAIPSDFTGGNPVILAGQGTFNFAVSGETIIELDTGTLLYNFLPAEDRLPPRNQLYIAASDAVSSQELSFEFTPAIELGIYPLVAPADYAPGAVAVSYTRLIFDGTQTRVESFNENIEGTLRITRIGEAASGQFQFTADYTETSPQGEIDVQAVEVTGEFTDVAYQITLDDPFQNEVPLPTRNFTTDQTQQP